jgi:hypothetical protein
MMVMVMVMVMLLARSYGIKYDFHATFCCSVGSLAIESQKARESIAEYNKRQVMVACSHENFFHFPHTSIF